MRFALVVLVVAALGACQSVPAPGRGDGATARPPALPRAVIHGRAFHLERLLLAAGAVLDVQLIDDSIADAPAGSGLATVARMSYGDLHGPPYAFDLPYDPARVVAGHHYSVRAALRTPDGRLAFATAARVPVEPGASTPVEFRLARVPQP
ncbi:YbaY family lipoprotein [Dokdonella sp.]|uniref:YbaY family lipoprotein n=1 Tax=Dokdonella sp. TaxID=2291710 RepID=UPI002F412E98